MAASGTQFVKIALQADVGGYVKGITESTSATNRLIQTIALLGRGGKAALGELNAAADQIANAGKKVAMFGAASGIALSATVVSAAKIQADIKNVETISKGLNDSMINPLLAMSQRLPQSASELATGLYNVVSSGFDGAKALEVLNASAMAASAGLSSTQNASTALTAVLNAYGKEAPSVAAVSDYLFQTVNLGVVTFDQLTNVIGEFVGTAAAAKVGIKDAGAALATMTLSGIDANEAGTSMNRVLQALIQPSEKLTQAWSTMSKESLQTALANDGLYAVMEKLRQASKGNISTLLDWFPELRAARGALALMSDEGKNYTRVQEQMGLATSGVGMTQKALAKQGESLSFQWKIFQNTMKAVGIDVGTTFVPAVTQAVKVGTQFASVWFLIPRGLREVASWASAAGSALLILGGVLLALYAKHLLFNGVLGTGLTRMKNWGTGMAAAGGQGAYFGMRVAQGATMAQTAMDKMTRPLGTVRTIFEGLGTGANLVGNRLNALGTHFQTTQTRAGKLSGVAETMGTAFISSGIGIQNFGSRIQTASGRFPPFSNLLSATGSNLMLFGAHSTNAGMALLQSGSAADSFGKSTSVLGRVLPAVGGALNKFGTGVNNVASSFKTMIGLGSVFMATLIGAGMVWQSGQQMGQQVVAGWRKGLETTSLKSYTLAIKDAKDQYDKFTESMFGSTPEKINDFWDVITYVPERLGTAAKDAAKAVGFDMGMEPGSMQAASQATAMKKGLEGLKAEAKQVETNLRLAWYQLHPQQMKSGIKPTIQDLEQLGAGAKEAGIDLTATGKKGIQAQQDLVAATRTLNDYIGQTGTELANVGAVALAEKQRIADAMKSAADATQKAFMGMASTTKFAFEDLKQESKPEDYVPPSDVDQLQAYYEKQLTASGKFYANMQDLIRRGLSPTIISELMQAGPEAAGRAAQALVDDTSGRLIQTANSTVAVLSQLAYQAALFAKDAQNAVEDKSGKKAKDLPTAAAIRGQMFAQGGKATANSIAEALGLDPATVAAVADEFGIQLAADVKVSFDKELKKDPGLGKNLTVAMYDMMNNPALKNVSTASLSKIMEAYIKDGLSGAQSAIENDKTLSVTEQVELKLKIKEMDAKQKLIDVVENMQIPESRKEVIIEAILKGNTTPDDVMRLAEALHLTPAQTIAMLEVQGTPEAETKIGQIKSAIIELKSNHIPITIENVEALLKIAATGGSIDDLKLSLGLPMYINIENQNAINTIQNTKDMWENWTPSTKVVNASGASTSHTDRSEAHGDVLTFADGGHQATFGRGAVTRKWNEPETGGEAYIPLGRSKRKRSLMLWAQTGKILGAYADGGMAAAPMVPHVSAGGYARIGAVTTVKTEINFNAPVYGEQHLRTSVVDILDAHDRKMEIDLQRDRSGM